MVLVFWSSMLSPRGGTIENVMKNVKQRRKSLDTTLFCAVSGNQTRDSWFKGKWVTCTVELTKVGFSCCQDFCLRFIVREANYNNIIMSKNFESVPQKLMVEIIRRRQVPQVILRTTLDLSVQDLTHTDNFGQLRWTKTIKMAKSRNLHLALSTGKRAQTGKS